MNHLGVPCKIDARVGVPVGTVILHDSARIVAVGVDADVVAVSRVVDDPGVAPIDAVAAVRGLAVDSVVLDENAA